MVTITEDSWPMATVSFDDMPTVEETETFLEHFDEWLTRDERFGLLIVTTTGIDTQPDRDATKRQISWVRENQPRIEQNCAGLARVVHSDELTEQSEDHTQVVENLYGCPAAIFDEQNAAERWLTERLSA